MRYTDYPLKYNAIILLATAGCLERFLMGKGIEHLLGIKEKKEYLSYRSEKRRKEWLLGRYCAKIAIAQATGIPLNRIMILRNYSGSTTARIGCFTLPVSISHSKGAAASIAAKLDYVGIDLERIRPLSKRAKLYFLAESERKLAGSKAEAIRLWTLKEAVAKARGTGLLFNPQKIRITKKTGVYSTTGKPKLNLISFKWRNYMVSAALRK